MTNKTINLLIIDDDKADVELFSAWIRDPMPGYQFNVYKAYSAAAGYMALEEEDIHCIVVDYKMAGDTGLDFIKTISNTHKECPVILSTAFPDELLELESIEQGAQFFFRKSDLNKDTFRHQILEAVELHQSNLLTSYHTAQKMLVRLKYEHNPHGEAETVA